MYAKTRKIFSGLQHKNLTIERYKEDYIWQRDSRRGIQ